MSEQERREIIDAAASSYSPARLDYLVSLSRTLTREIDVLTLDVIGALCVVREAVDRAGTDEQRVRGDITFGSGGAINLHVIDPEHARKIARRLALGKPRTGRTPTPRTHLRWTGTVGGRDVTVTTDHAQEQA